MHKQELANRLKAVCDEVSSKTLEETLFSLCESIDSPRSLSVWLLFVSKEHDQLLDLDVKSCNYSCERKFADDYLITSFLSKYPFLAVSFDPEAVAFQKFTECEDLCRATNKKFQELELDPSRWDPSLHSTFRRARRKIAQVLGSPNLDRISELFGWGPGATSASKSSRTTVYDKFQARLDVTSNSLIMGHCCINSTPSWVNCQLQTDIFPSIDASLTRESFNVIRGNEIVFVPKNAKTHRTIAIEPHVNSYLQKGFGGYIRQRLRNVAGIDLNDQTLNQRLARQGSLDGTLATIDLSGASDTIATQLVRFLLPDRWFVLLDSVRCKQGFVRKDNHWIHYEKFSSMGNGFTFELESLIFWALCKACQEESGEETALNVYGDDIIVHVDIFESVAKVLDFAGFKFNHKKSFSSGVFRESCGKDYFLGHEVRPIFLKEKIANVESIFKLANSIRRYSHIRNSYYGCDKRFHSAWVGLHDRVSPFFRGIKIPEGFGDVGFIGNTDEANPIHAVHDGWCGMYFRMLSRRALKKPMRDRNAGYTSILSAVGSEMPLLGFVSPRGKTQPVLARGYTFEWYNLGSWS